MPFIIQQDIIPILKLTALNKEKLLLLELSHVIIEINSLDIKMKYQISHQGQEDTKCRRRIKLNMY